MKILVDCSTAKKGGARTYLQELLKALAQLRGPNRWIVYGPFGCRTAAPSLPDSVELRELPRIWASPTGHLAWLAGRLPRIARREEIHVVFAATGFGMPSPVCPQMVLVRNPIYFSDLYARQLKGLWARLELSFRRWVSLKMIRRSGAALFPTQAMRDLVASVHPLDGIRVVIAPYGCDGEAFRRKPQDARWLPEPLARETNRFLLNVSLYCAQKNFAVLFKALGILRRQGRDCLLALTTRLHPVHSSTFREDRAVILRERLEGQILQLGLLPRERLPALYQAAGLFVFPSYLESFGHPLVEAMAAGLPILAADTQVNREVCGPAAVYAPPFDPEGWAAQIRRLLEDPGERGRLGQAAQIQAARFSWQAHVTTIVRVAEELAGRRA